MQDEERYPQTFGLNSPRSLSEVELDHDKSETRVNVNWLASGFS